MVRIATAVDKKNVEDIIRETEINYYCLPTFQRDFVWDEDDIKEFIDSIIKGCPIGSIILWRPSREFYKNDPFTRSLIGSPENAENKDIYYVIDGQQRLTSLLLLFNNWKIKRDDEEIAKSPISIVVGKDSYRLYKSEKKGTNLYEAIKAFASNPAMRDYEIQRKIERQLSSEAQEMLYKIIGKILSYEIPIYILRTTHEDETTFSEMAEAFTRVNKAGVRIGNVELMLSFIAGRIRGPLKNEIISIYKNLEAFKIDLQPIIRCVLSQFEIPQTDITKVKQFDRVIDRILSIPEKEILARLADARNSLQLAVNFLGERLGIKDTRILPSQVPIITIARYFSSNGITNLSQLDERSLELIETWFVLVNFNGYYSSNTDTKLESDLKIVKERGSFPFEELLENIERRRARVKIGRKDLEEGLRINVLRGRVGKSYLFLLYILLIKNEADDWTNRKIRERDFDDLAKHHIFPREFLLKNLEIEDENPDIYVNNIGNITFIDKSLNSEIGDSDPIYLRNHSLSLERHFIPREENLWKIDTYEAFLKSRITMIHTKAKEVYPHIFE
ncbi:MULTISPECIES: DUF262 domain-containing protein [unclassified Archaeoglobus]|jgi:hypothetical protein|uniref:DUF262 domain-containing protein n=1 Tax=unclassified Archaeoglobus TaxID=2643606 RepID=UPI0025C536AD|nr:MULTISPECIES: DUF262 domain-containing protein [unclassified Archaeoglobus]